MGVGQSLKTSTSRKVKALKDKLKGCYLWKHLSRKSSDNDVNNIIIEAQGNTSETSLLTRKKKTKEYLLVLLLVLCQNPQKHTSW